MTSQAQIRSIDLSEISPEILLLLRECGAMKRPHSGRTLFHHLIGTYSLLRSWGNADSVCFSGLFHSIYGTNAFKHKTLLPEHRPRLQKLIGNKSEALAWAFCHINRPWAIIESFEGKAFVMPEIELTAQDWAILAEIEVANLIEQGDIGNALRDLYCVELDHPGALSTGAFTALKYSLSQHLHLKHSAHS